MVGFEPGNAATKEGVVWAFRLQWACLRATPWGTRRVFQALFAGQRSVAQL